MWRTLTLDLCSLSAFHDGVFPLRHVIPPQSETSRGLGWSGSQAWAASFALHSALALLFFFLTPAILVNISTHSLEYSCWWKVLLWSWGLNLYFRTWDSLHRSSAWVVLVKVPVQWFSGSVAAPGAEVKDQAQITSGWYNPMDLSHVTNDNHLQQRPLFVWDSHTLQLSHVPQPETLSLIVTDSSFKLYNLPFMKWLCGESSMKAVMGAGGVMIMSINPEHETSFLCLLCFMWENLEKL